MSRPEMYRGPFTSGGETNQWEIKIDKTSPNIMNKVNL